MSARDRGIRSVPENLEPGLEDFLQDVHRLLRTGLKTGVLSADPSAAFGTGTGGTGSTDPDLTPPPTPSGLTVTAGFANLLIQWGTATYTWGHGNRQTNIYGAKWPTGGPEPTFADAVVVGEAAQPLNIYALATELGTRWCIWIKFLSNDDVETNTPAGGLHGVQATTGLVGNADLGPLIVTAEKLSQGTYPNINLVPNPGAEDGTVCWARVEGAGVATLTVDTTTKSGGLQSFRVTKTVLSDGISYGCQAFPVIPGETYAVRARVLGSSASASGFYMVMQEGIAKPATGYVGTVAGNDARTSATVALSNLPIPATWTTYEGTYVVPAGIYWVTLSLHNWVSSTAMSMWFDDVSFGRQITAAFLAANSIAVGSAAIQNGAIVNAMIANATIDDAKIANLSASKINAGSMSAAYITAGTITADRMVAGVMSADNVLTRNLTVRDGSGNIILSSGTNTIGGNGGNLIKNPTFLQRSVANWGIGANVMVPDALASAIAALDGGLSAYSLNGNETGILHVAGAFANDSYYAEVSPLAGGAYFKITPGKWYQFSVLVNPYRCGCQLYGINYSSALSLLSYSGYPGGGYSGLPANGTRTDTYKVGGGTGYSGSGQNENNYLRLYYTFQAGAGEVQHQPCIRLFQTTGDVDSYIFMARAMFCEVAPNTNFAVPFDFGGGAFQALQQLTGANASTFIANAAIGAAQIGSLNADVITAGSIRGINVNASSHTTRGSYLTSAASAAATTLNVKDTTDFAASGSGVFMDTSNDRDVFTYTGKTATTLTGCSGVLAHNNGATVLPSAKTMAMDLATNEMRFFGDRGDGTIEELASIGIASIGGDTVVINGGSTLSTNVGVRGRSFSNAGVFGSTESGYGVYGAAASGYGVYGGSDGVAGVRGVHTSGGPGVWGGASNGYGGRFDGNATRGNLMLTPLTGRPSNRALGSVAMINTSGGTTDARTGNPLLMFTDGTNWYYISATLFSG